MPKDRKEKGAENRPPDVRPQISDLPGNTFGFAGSDERKDDSLPFRSPGIKEECKKTTGKSCGDTRQMLGCQMMNQGADLFEVKGFVDEAVNPQVNGLLEKGVSSL